ncbi:MAG: SDR family NAD(P)-dependent oxidoreductase [Dehalococcoidia bacterium]|nr:SDR family NAD(P)-dependent oxidoreductase [Dehalococcoidia bacterium]
MVVSLAGQVALVTGGGRGIGQAVALDLARHGARVLVNDTGGDLAGRGTDAAVAEAVAATIREAGGEAAANAGSVADYEDAYTMVKQAVDAWGRLDIVVSNAGFLRDQALHNMKPEDWQAIVDTHLTGAYNVLHHAWPVFRQQRYGRVVLTSSNSGFIGNFGQANYGAAKGGLIGLMNVAKLEGQKYEVMVNCLGPGAATRMTEGLMPAERAAVMSPNLVAPAVTYLCSPECHDSGFIVEAGGGRFGRAAIVRNQGINLERPDADAVAARWKEITSLEGAETWWSMRQTLAEREAERAGQAAG